MRHGYCGSYGWPSGARLSPASGQIKGPAHDLIHAYIPKSVQHEFIFSFAVDLVPLLWLGGENQAPIQPIAS